MKGETVIVIYTFALVSGLVAVAALLAYVGVVLGARTPLTIRFVWPLRGTWEPFKARRHRQLAADVITAELKTRSAQQRSEAALLKAYAETCGRQRVADIVPFPSDPRRV